MTDTPRDPDSPRTDDNRDSSFDPRRLTRDRWPVPDWHFEQIEKETRSSESKAGMLGVIQRMGDQTAPDFSGIDWDAELAGFGPLEFPTYYRQPFHSVPGGYLSEAAAVGDRRAMQAIYQHDHPERCLGIRSEIAALVPEHAKRVVEFGAGTGDGAAAVARRLPAARVTALEASPFMIIAGRIQNADAPNLEFVQGLAEESKLEDESVDALMITLLFHECPDKIKRDILAEAHRVLRPGGTIVLSDTPMASLHDYRGFYEPYKEQWSSFDPESALSAAGFEAIINRDVVPTLFTRIARKPENG